MRASNVVRPFLVVPAFLVIAAAASAQATRTWVSGVGDDANPCARTAPCKTFAGAISKTAPDGVIDVLDPGGYGAVTITKAITIQAEGGVAGVLVSGTNGIVIAAGPTDRVVLRGLSFEGLGTGLDAVKFLSGLALFVENCTIHRFTGWGINFAPSSTATLFVSDTIIRDDNFGALGGIVLQPATGVAAHGTLSNVRIERCGVGVEAMDGSNVAIKDSVVSKIANGAILAFSSSAPATILADDVLASDSGIGVTAQGAMAKVILSRTSIFGNATGIAGMSGGQIVSLRNNTNLDSGSPSSTILEQ